MWFKKISMLPHTDWNSLGGWGGGFSKIKSLKKCMKLNWNLQRGWRGRVLKKTLSLEYGYFLELTQHVSIGGEKSLFKK